jgi:hypothetical protein
MPKASKPKEAGEQDPTRRHADPPTRRHADTPADTPIRRSVFFPSPADTFHFSRKTLMAVKKSIARWRIRSLTCCRLDLPLA